MPWPPFLTLSSSKKKTELMVPNDWNMRNSFDAVCSLWPGADPGGQDEGYASSYQPFSKMFLMQATQFFHNFEPLR